jgi:hypothetical protein
MPLIGISTLRGRVTVVAAVLCLLAGLAGAQQPGGAGPQSPRQAALEMLSGDEAAFKRHLTQEMLARLDERSRNAASANASPLEAIRAVQAARVANWEQFDSGPVLFSLTNVKEHERLEIRIASDDLRGDDDDMLLTIHLLRNGVEQDVPAILKILLSWKQQQGTWRLNEFTIGARFPVGDPRILDKSWWSPPVLGPLIATGGSPSAAPAPTANDRPRMTIARSLRLIGLAENIYANKHPEAGFTCAIRDLVEIGKGLDNGETYKFMDPEFGDGLYNGYRFSITGCYGKPAKAFRAAAEPISGTGRAYCTDATHELRGADDGHAATCLASGKPVLH